MKHTKKIFCTVFIATLILSNLVGCTNKSADNNQSTIDTATVTDNNESTESTANSEELSEMLKIYEESMKENIETYCIEYLTFVDSPVDNIDLIKDIITTDHLDRIQLISDAPDNGGDKDKKIKYEQATALSELFYSDYSVPSTRTKVLAQCYQTVTVDSKVTTSKVFYLFSMKYEDGRGWLIDSVDIPSNAF